MSRRARRRWLVVGIYAVLAGLIVGMWFVDQWQARRVLYLSGPAMLRVLAVSWRVLLAAGWLKPFTEQGPAAIGVRLHRWLLLLRSSICIRRLPGDVR